MVAVLVLSLSALVYVYVGYPALLRLLVWIRGPRRVRQRDHTAAQPGHLRAYNESEVIGRKLDNALSLVYPGDRLEIVVVSDASDDGTDEVVARYASRGVRLIRQPSGGARRPA